MARTHTHTYTHTHTHTHTQSGYFKEHSCIITQVITDVMRVSNHSNSDVHVACLKCFAAVLSSHAPLTEVEVWLSSSRNSSGEQSKACTSELTNQKMAAKTPTRPWVISHCLRLFGANGTVLLYDRICKWGLIYTSDFVTLKRHNFIYK